MFQALFNANTGRACDEHGEWLLDGALPPEDDGPEGDWAPFRDQLQFKVGEFLFRQEQMSGGNIDHLMRFWKESLPPWSMPPFENHNDLLQTIDAIPYGRYDWSCFTVGYLGEESLDENCPPFMRDRYEVWHRNAFDVVAEMVANRDFDGEFDYAPFQEYHEENHHFQDFMSGNWAWRQAVRVAVPRTVIFD